MTDYWYTAEIGTPATAVDAYTSEDGSKGTGWVYSESPDESDTYWYYLVSVTTDGKTQRSVPFNENGSEYAAKVIKSKTYLFNSNGEMQDGLVTLEAATPSSWQGITAKSLEAGTYYFSESSGSTNGQMITGKTTVTDDGETYNYYFDKTTGAAITNIVKDGIVYGPTGDRIDADDGNSNMVYTVGEAGIAYSKAANGTGFVEGDRIIVSSTGKLRTSGTVKIDGVKYTITKGKITAWEDVE
jgi:hypothetical protein